MKKLSKVFVSFVLALQLALLSPFGVFAKEIADSGEKNKG